MADASGQDPDLVHWLPKAGVLASGAVQLEAHDLTTVWADTAGPDDADEPVVEVRYYASLDCSDDPLPNGGASVNPLSAPHWRRASAPIGARAAQVRLGLGTPIAGIQMTTFDGVGLTSGIARGDLDGDGQTDLIVRDAVSGDYELWRMSGATRIERLPLEPQPSPTTLWSPSTTSRTTSTPT